MDSLCSWLPWVLTLAILLWFLRCDEQPVRRRYQSPNPAAGVQPNMRPMAGLPEAGGTIGSTPNASFAPGAAFSGADLGENVFSPSDATTEFYNTYNPTSLSQLMPSHWRADKCEGVAADPDIGQFSEFSRYSISPEALQKSENLRGVLRLRENTRTSNSKSLGYTSLLAEAVRPLGAVPIGSNAFFSNDSQLRQGYIAEATGKYPVETSC